MNEHVHVVCPFCITTNRVPRERLDAGAQCGHCQQALLAGQPFELSKAGFDRHVGCAPCLMMAPAYAEAAARRAPDVRLGKLDTEAEPEIAARFGIRNIPTLIAFRNGRETARQSGAMNLPGLLGWIRGNV